jgi:hypothetical protein
MSMMSVHNQSAGRGKGSSGDASLSLVTPASLQAWIEGAQPGAQIRYYSGHFAGEGSEAVNDALRLAESRGLIFLVQRRRAQWLGGYDYLAIRSSRSLEGKPPAREPRLYEAASAEIRRRGW